MKGGVAWVGMAVIALAGAISILYQKDLSCRRALDRLADPRQRSFPCEACDPCTPGELAWCYDRGDRRVRAAILDALLERQWTDVEGIVRKAASDPDPRLRRKAVTAGPWREKGYFQLLRDALRDPEDGIRRQAAYVLASRGDRSGMALLQEDLLSPDGTVRSSAISAVCGVGTEAERLEACALLGASSEEHDRCLATYNLSQQRAAVALPRLARMLTDPSFNVRREAVDGVVQMTGLRIEYHEVAQRDENRDRTMRALEDWCADNGIRLEDGAGG